MEWKRITKGETLDEFNRINFMNDVDFANEKSKWGAATFVEEEYEEFRKALIDVKNSFLDKYNITNLGGKNTKARFDMEIGLKLYELTSAGKYKMTLRDSSDNSIWWYISLFVVPDLVYFRHNYGKEEKTGNRLHADSFYAKTRRIWLKTLWWYVFLSLQFDDKGTADLDKTRKTIIWSSTDNILQVVDRAGLGYIPELTRSIIRRYFSSQDNKNMDDELLRKVMKMNTAKSKVQNPILIGIDEYVNSLFAEFV